MSAIRYRVPYQFVIVASDAATGKRITNTLYFRCGVQSASPPAYGAVIAGSGDTATVAATMLARLHGSITPLLNENYQEVEYDMTAIVGKRYTTPLTPILALVSSLTTIVTTSGPHGLASGAVVNVIGVTVPSAANGLWTITVVSPTSFSLNGSGTFASWSGDGSYQLPGLKSEFLLADLTVQLASDTGGIVDDALPLYCTGSVRRRSAGVGRNFRSRLSFSPISESDSLDGGLVAGTLSAWATALSGLFSTGVNNGGSDAGSQLMMPAIVSKTIALGLPTPFTQSDTWCQDVTAWNIQPNTGSLIRRKPRLTSIIA